MRTRLGHGLRISSILALPILIGSTPVPSLPDGHLVGVAHAARARAGKGKQSAKDFSYTVSDCHEAGELESIRLELSEGAVAFAQVLDMNCIAATRPNSVKLAYAKHGRDLEVTITLRSEVLSDCTCPIGIEGRIANLDKGSYRILFVFDHPPDRAPNDKPIRRTVGSKEFDLP
jgi:hypothetical protein